MSSFETGQAFGEWTAPVVIVLLGIYFGYKLIKKIKKKENKEK